MDEGKSADRLFRDGGQCPSQARKRDSRAGNAAACSDAPAAAAAGESESRGAKCAADGHSGNWRCQPRRKDSIRTAEPVIEGRPEATLGIVVENVNDLFSIPLLLQYNPAVISVEEVQHGGFLSGGTQEIAIVHQPFKDKGQSIISATRRPNTPGVSGSGTLIGIVIKALAPGSSTLSIVQVNAKDSQQKLIPLITSEATVQVQP